MQLHIEVPGGHQQYHQHQLHYHLSQHVVIKADHQETQNSKATSVQMDIFYTAKQIQEFLNTLHYTEIKVRV